MTRWRPARAKGFSMMGIPAQSEPLIKIPKRTAAWVMTEDILFGVLVGGLGFVSAAPGCLTLSPSRRTEWGLATGLGLTGLVWLFNGRNYFAIAGAASTLLAYGACKLLESKIPGLLKG